MAPNTIPALAKIAGNYLSGQLVKMEALANGFAEAIALGPDGMLSEGSGQNVFLVSRGTLYTPPNNGSILMGITRDSILTLARDLGLPVKEQQIPLESLFHENDHPIAYLQVGAFFRRVPLVVGTRNKDKIVVSRGLRPGQRIALVPPPTALILNGAHEPRSGSPARKRPTPPHFAGDPRVARLPAH